METGDIFRMCQTKDEPIRDWVKLAATRAKASGSPALFWLDENRAHDSEILKKVKAYLPDHDTDGLDIRVMKPVDAMKFSLERIRRGEDTISVTGNVLRDYLTDLFPILELGTSARMLSIVPLLHGGGLFETGAGGSAPKHVQQTLKEGHLRWDSLGEVLRPRAVCRTHREQHTNNAKASLLGETLDQAIGTYLENARYPSRKVTRSTTGQYLLPRPVLAQALAAQEQDEALKTRFATVAGQLAENEAVITAELLSAQGHPVDIAVTITPTTRWWRRRCVQAPPSTRSSMRCERYRFTASMTLTGLCVG